MQRRQLLGGLFATVGVGALIRPGVAWSASAPTSPPGVIGGPSGQLPIATRNQGMGKTDASGFVTLFPLQSGALQVWVDNVQGDPSYNGLSPYPGFMMNGTGANQQVGATGPGAANAAYGPKTTYADALNSVSSTMEGIGNQFFFAEGQTFTLDTIVRYDYEFYGNGATYPACFQSFDPTDPLNTAKHGRAGTGSRGARPIWQLGTGQFPENTNGSSFDYGGWAFRGLEWLAVGDGQYCSWYGQNNNLLFENVVFNNVQLTLESDITLSSGYSTNNILRMCASYGQYDTQGSHICGIFSIYTNLTIEDCVFWHCGWEVGVSRDTPVSAGGPDIYKHCVYVDSGRGTTAIIRRNVMVDGSASGLSLRGTHMCHHNVIIDCPTPDFMSGGSNTDSQSPNGVTQQAFCQLVMGGADINSTQPRMQGFRSSDGTPSSYYAYSLYINNPGYGQVNNIWLQVQNEIPAQISNMGFYHNRAYAFAPASARLVLGTVDNGSISSINVYADVDNLTSATSPMTNDAIYAQAGYSSKDALVQAMIGDPSQTWAYKLLGAAGNGFAFNFNYSLPFG
jgi:hypothetical protein